jgi:thymidylate synthase (FAD)
MPKEVPLFIENIARMVVDRKAVERWMEHIGADEFEIPEEGTVTDPALLIALACKRCYMSFQPSLNPNLTMVRKDFAKYLDNVLTSRHGSVLEHSVYSFAMEGISRVFTAEMNRHRAGWAISEGSLRFIRFDKEIPFWMPTSLQVQDDDDADLNERKVLSQKVFHEAFKHQEEMYAKLVEIWDMDAASKNFGYKKKVTSCLRRIVGMGVATGGVWTGNLRALRHVIAMRTDPAAEEEIFEVFRRIGKHMIENEPMLFHDFEEHDTGFLQPRNWKV